MEDISSPLSVNNGSLNRMGEIEEYKRYGFKRLVLHKILNYKTMVIAKTQKQNEIKISLHSKFTISVLMIFSCYFCSNELP